MKWFSLSENAMDIGTLTLRLQCIGMPLIPLNFMASISYQTLGKKTAASVLSVSRQGLFYVPAVLLLPRIIGLLGVQSCQMVADVFAFVFAIPFTISFFRMLKWDELVYEKAKAEGQVFDEEENVSYKEENFGE